MSYYTVTLENDVRLSADQLNENLLKYIKNNLISNYEGKISILTNSYIIKILSFPSNAIPFKADSSTFNIFFSLLLIESGTFE